MENQNTVPIEYPNTPEKDKQETDEKTTENVQNTLTDIMLNSGFPS